MVALVADTFSRAHISATAATTGFLAAGAALWRLRGARRFVEAPIVGALAAAAVFLWRVSANMPQLNDDGLPGYSANDWLAPVVTFVVLSLYADLRPPRDPGRYAQVRAAVTIVALVVNVVTI